MLKEISSEDKLEKGQFLHNEVRYNLIHRIREAESSICLTTLEGSIIYAQSKGNNGWLWVTTEVSGEVRAAMLRELAEYVRDSGVFLPGVTGDPVTVELFAEVYSALIGARYHTSMNMEAYYCPLLKKPSAVKGILQRATIDHIDIVSEFLAGFSEGAFGVSVTPHSQLAAAEGIIRSGNLSLWLIDGHPVAMANIAHRSPRHARINAVYTPVHLRGKGYASAAVAELGAHLTTEGLVPMLYADLKNPASNKLYQNIGFVACGPIRDIKFTS
jgi:predicted GNAT family acetyltransferase